MKIVLEPRRLTRLLCLVVIVLVLAHFATQFSRFVLGHERLFGLVRMFSLGMERNIPTLYAGGTLVLSAGLLAVIGCHRHRLGAPFARHWWFLAIVFAFLSMDEVLCFHEEVSKIFRLTFNTSGMLHFAWVIPYGLLAVFLLVAYLPFLSHLPSRTRFLLLLAGAVYVAGAIGMELLGGRHYEINGSDNPAYVLLQTIEETLEMCGIVIFIHGLTSYLAIAYPVISLRIGSAPSPPPPDSPSENRAAEEKSISS